MKILIFADNHFCETYSIIQKHGFKYTKRLENQLKTMAWIKATAEQLSCDMIISLGDFFDKNELTDQEITASKDIEWAQIPTYFIVGNHESEDADLQFNSTKTLEAENRFIISEPTSMLVNNCELCFLPYITETNRQAIVNYFNTRSATHRVIFSHNDIKGIQMGPVISRAGFEIEDIENNCDLFINGHLHNGVKITEKVINLGNITGKDFGEDASKYTHNALILDTETLQYELIPNPFAFNFYKIEINSPEDFWKLGQLKENAVVSIKCNDNLLDVLHLELDKYSNLITESRIIAVRDTKQAEKTTPEVLPVMAVDHLTRFVECCRENIEITDVLEAELAEICK